MTDESPALDYSRPIEPQLAERLARPGRLSVFTGERGTGHTDMAFRIIDAAIRSHDATDLILLSSIIDGATRRRWGFRVSDVGTLSSLRERLVDVNERGRRAIVFVESVAVALFPPRQRRAMFPAPLADLLYHLPHLPISLVFDSSGLNDGWHNLDAGTTGFYPHFGMDRPTRYIEYGVYAVKLSLTNATVYLGGRPVRLSHIPPTEVGYNTRTMGTFAIDEPAERLEKVLAGMFPREPAAPGVEAP